MIIQSKAPMCANKPKMKSRSPFLPCYFLCLVQVEGWVVRGLPEANQVGWGFESTACRPLSLRQSGPADGNVAHGYGRTRGCEEAMVLCRRTETRRWRRHREPATLETYSTHVRRIPGRNPGPGLPQIFLSGSTLPSKVRYTDVIKHKMLAVLR